MDVILDQDVWSKAVNLHGGRLLQTIIGDDKFPEPASDIEREKQAMCNFIKKKMKMLFQFNEEVPAKLPEHSIPIVPIEIFQDVSVVDRRDLFYQTLDRGHILILRVINDNLPDNYKLLVLCKQENHMKLDDLSLIMFLPKLPAELDLAGGKLEANDLIRAAVCSCSIDERRLYVTLDKNILEDETDVYLGKITEKDLPFYVGEVDLGPSYAEYLHNNTSYFNQPDWVEELHTVLNVERNYLYSFMENLDGYKYVDCVMATELRKRQILNVSIEQHEKGLKLYADGNLKEAFSCFNQSLDNNPNNVEALISRGIVYSDIKNCKKAYEDVEAALKLDPNNERGLKQMSKLLVLMAKAHLEHKDLQKARESLDAALYVDSSNTDAVTALEELKNVNFSEKPTEKSPVKVPGPAKVPIKKHRLGSVSSDRSDSSSSKKDDGKEDYNLKVATNKFLNSMQKKHPQPNKGKKFNPRFRRKVKSPKSTTLITLT